MEDIRYDKKILRQQCLKIREENASGEKAVLARERLLASDCWKGAETVALYASMGSELSTYPLLARAWRQGKTVLLPKITDTRLKLMEFVTCGDISELKPGKFGILEPAEHYFVSLQARIDIMIIPGLAFDMHGNRLGYGGGYYDTFLARRAEAGADMPQCIGLCFSFQILDYVPHDSLDYKMNVICSEEGLECL